MKVNEAEMSCWKVESSTSFNWSIEAKSCRTQREPTALSLTQKVYERRQNVDSIDEPRYPSPMYTMDIDMFLPSWYRCSAACKRQPRCWLYKAFFPPSDPNISIDRFPCIIQCRQANTVGRVEISITLSRFSKMDIRRKSLPHIVQSTRYTGTLPPIHYQTQHPNLNNKIFQIPPENIHSTIHRTRRASERASRIQNPILPCPNKWLCKLIR